MGGANLLLQKVIGLNNFCLYHLAGRQGCQIWAWLTKCTKNYLKKLKSPNLVPFGANLAAHPQNILMRTHQATNKSDY